MHAILTIMHEEKHEVLRACFEESLARQFRDSALYVGILWTNIHVKDISAIYRDATYLFNELKMILLPPSGEGSGAIRFH